jgi:hypothetical protein
MPKREKQPSGKIFEKALKQMTETIVKAAVTEATAAECRDGERCVFMKHVLENNTSQVLHETESFNMKTGRPTGTVVALRMNDGDNTPLTFCPWCGKKMKTT